MNREGRVAGDRWIRPAPVMLKADLHVHSSHSHDVPDVPAFTPRALYQRALQRGMSFFTLTDHDTLSGIEALQRELRKEFGTQLPIPLVSGVELKIPDPAVGHVIHVNIFGLDARQLGDLVRSTSSVERLTRYCRRHGLFHVYNHPFWFERGETGKVETIEQVAALFPIIELNAGRIPELNARTAMMAGRLGKPLVATTDTHTGQVGKAYTLAPGPGPEEFLRNIGDGLSQPIASHFVFDGFLQEIAETVDHCLRDPHPPEARRELPAGTADPFRGVQRLLEHPRLRRTVWLREGVGLALKLAARAPTRAFIRQQRRMLVRLGEGGC